MTKRIGILDDENELEIEDYAEGWVDVFERSSVLHDDHPNVRSNDELVLVVGDSDEEIKKMVKSYLKSQIDEMYPY